MSERASHDYDYHRTHQELLALAAELGFAETAEMGELKKQILVAPDFDSARDLCIQYRMLAEPQASQQMHDALQGLMAQIGLMLGMAALYWENQRLEELGEYYFAELEHAELAASNIQDQARREKILILVNGLL